ncbi:3-oxoacyl-[acyl-carrier-protein] reductase FabG [Anatilimnocola aggregata]|uniref:3-oxoacyl-[acyl-carrier-protein] reductase FabG n=1 Tax=Anatilimnocola aggregata TaxID=2528021 RepID=A0A517YG15_9BACT|nr:SDR family oxidoreductase [Anatilimnocola aggregata]QDU29164.1 3-oxoacyl-[acyl-carrier-protein] reductase FabG [Anatilimnocola aggregata]
MAPARRIVLTGATRGLGRALADKFIAAGHTVIGCGRSEGEITKLQQQFGSPHRFDVLDVSSEPDVRRWAESVLANSDAPDLLINNAATINPNAPLWEVEPADFDRVIDVNINGVFYVLRHLVPAMVQQRKGVIVNLSSGWGRSTSPDVATYCATKYAIEGLTLALAQELPRGMAAVPLNPGVINTELLRSCFGGSAGSYPTPHEWARQAAPYILALGPRDNGQSRTVPG